MNEFKLLDHFEIKNKDEALIETKIDNEIIDNIINLKINQNNIYDVLRAAEFLQFTRLRQLIDKIQEYIYADKINIDKIELNNDNLYDEIYDSDCIKNKICICDYNTISSISCYNKFDDEYIDAYIIDRLCNYKKCNYLLIKYLLDNNKDCTEAAINNASINRHYEIVKLLLEHYKSCTKDAIYWACCYGYYDIVKLLLDHNKPCTYYAINMACRNGHYDIVKLLLDHDKPFTEHAIDWACINGHYEIVKFLLEHNKDCTAYAIYYSSEKGNYDIVKLLLDNNKPFTLNTIRVALTNEIKNLLINNLHLLIKVD